MDKRFRSWTSDEEYAVRRALDKDIDTHPERPVHETIRLIRTTLHLTIAEYARVSGISARGLQDIERGIKSPTLDTVAKLLKPMGLKVGVVSQAIIERAKEARRDD